MNRKTILAALAAATCLGALPAAAQDWSRTGPRGGTASGGLACERAGGLACTNDFAIAGPRGQTVTGTRESLRGPVRGRATTTLAGAEGAGATRTAPLRVYNRRDPGFRGRRPGRW